MMADSEEPFFEDHDAEDMQESLDSLYEQNRELLDAVRILEEAVPEIEDPVGVYITLFDFYNELESINDAGNALVEAAKRVGTDQHGDLVFFLYNQLELFSHLSPDAQHVYERLGHLIAEDAGELSADTLHLDQRKLFASDLIPEILLAAHLQRMHVLSDGEYLVVLQDLCWYSNHEPIAPRSVLFVLDDRGLPHGEKAVEFLAHDSNIPYLDLALIHLNPDLLDVLPEDFSVRRAACLIGEVGGEPMVAILNPYNLQLQEDVGRLLESEPHFYLTSASGYQHYLDFQREPTVAE